MATTSKRTREARRGFVASHRRAARTTRSVFFGVTASAADPRSSFRRHFTSTKTTTGPSRAMMSISPSGYLTFL